jgi:hypothetical protein
MSSSRAVIVYRVGINQRYNEQYMSGQIPKGEISWELMKGQKNGLTIYYHNGK